MEAESSSPSVLLVEPFYGGSHKQLIDLLKENIIDSCVFTLPAKKWHWRARTAALYFSQTIPPRPTYRVLFSSSVLNLCELVALRPDLAGLKKILYFHENQLVYPVRKDQERDFQYGYNQVLSCLVADVVVFNSFFNMDSFLSSISSFMKKIPDHRPKDLEQQIRPKCVVLSFPLQFPDVSRMMPKHKLLREQQISDQPQTHRSEDPHPAPVEPDCEPVPHQVSGDQVSGDQDSGDQDSGDQDSGDQVSGDQVSGDQDSGDQVSGDQVSGDQDSGDQDSGDQVQPLHIVWPHRWEHDKNPELFFSTLMRLKERKLNFKLSVLGETFTDIPAVFSEARQQLDAHVVAWGFQSRKSDYLRVLCEADVVVSTAKHEFFGVAMLEAVHCGCLPLCPKALVYPEIFPAQYLYSTPEQLVKRLQELCRRPELARRHVVKVDTSSFSWTRLKDPYEKLLQTQVPERSAGP